MMKPDGLLIYKVTENLLDAFGNELELQVKSWLPAVENFEMDNHSDSVIRNLLRVFLTEVNLKAVIIQLTSPLKETPALHALFMELSRHHTNAAGFIVGTAFDQSLMNQVENYFHEVYFGKQLEKELFIQQFAAP